MSAKHHCAVCAIINIAYHIMACSFFITNIHFQFNIKCSGWIIQIFFCRSFENIDHGNIQFFCTVFAVKLQLVINSRRIIKDHCGCTTALCFYGICADVFIQVEMRVVFIFFQRFFQIKKPGHICFLYCHGGQCFNTHILRKRKGEKIFFNHKMVVVYNKISGTVYLFAIINFKRLKKTIAALRLQTCFHEFFADKFAGKLFSVGTSSSSFQFIIGKKTNVRPAGWPSSPCLLYSV